MDQGYRYEGLPSQALLPKKLACDLCGGFAFQPTTLSRWGVSGATSMKRHLAKCRRATPEDRAVFARTHKWPPRTRRSRGLNNKKESW